MNGVWCDFCGHLHGPLYVCPSYSFGHKQRIIAQQDQWRTALYDPNWVADKDPVAVAIFRMFAGPPIDEEGS